METRRDAQCLEPLCARLAEAIHQRSARVGARMRTPEALRRECARLEPCLETARGLQRLIDASAGDRPLDPQGICAAELLEAQITLAGQGAVLASYIDSLQASEGVSPSVRTEAVEALSEARALHQRLEAALEGARLLLVEHDAACHQASLPEEVATIAQRTLERLGP